MNPVSATCIARIESGCAGLPKVLLNAPHGGCAEVYLHGAQVTSWKALDGVERLFLSAASPFCANGAIWGGIPVAFPQFGRFGPLPLHGLARLMTWQFDGADARDDQLVARFSLCDNAESRRLWDYAFCAELTVKVAAHCLAVLLSVRNVDNDLLIFTAGLHTYLAITDNTTAKLNGLETVLYRDALTGVVSRQSTPLLDFNDGINRIYFSAPSAMRLIDAERILHIQSVGFRDLVVWNPGAQQCATLASLQADDYRRFACVEAVTVGEPIVLEPGHVWQAEQRLLVQDTY